MRLWGGSEPKTAEESGGGSDVSHGFLQCQRRLDPGVRQIKSGPNTYRSMRLRNTCYHVFLEGLIRISGERFVYREDYCLDEIVLNLTVSVIGWLVNGPGEARETDIKARAGKFTDFCMCIMRSPVRWGSRATWR